MRLSMKPRFACGNRRVGIEKNLRQRLETLPFLFARLGGKESRMRFLQPKFNNHRKVYPMETLARKTLSEWNSKLFWMW
jgi:hypothetical protein